MLGLVVVAALVAVVVWGSGQTVSVEKARVEDGLKPNGMTAINFTLMIFAWFGLAMVICGGLSVGFH